MTRVACLLLQKNESSLIEPWIAYHASIFGLENLFVFDNGSDDPSVISILKKYARQGMFVDWTFSKPTDYPLKGDILSGKIAELRTERISHDIYLPLDCDEFVAVERNGRVDFDSESITDYLANLTRVDAICHVKTSYANVLGAPGYFHRRPYNKIFMNKNYVRPLDHGSHLPEVNDYQITETDIVFIHCHYKPFSILIQHARDKLRPFLDVDNVAALDHLVEFRGTGHHLIRYLRMTEEQYLAEFSALTAHHLPDFQSRLKQIGIDISFLGRTAGNGDPDADLNLEPMRSVAGYSSGSLPSRHAPTRQRSEPLIFIAPILSHVAARFLHLALSGAGVTNFVSRSESISMIQDDVLAMTMEIGVISEIQHLVAKRNRQVDAWVSFIPPASLEDLDLLGGFQRARVIVGTRNRRESTTKSNGGLPNFSRGTFSRLSEHDSRFISTVSNATLEKFIFHFDSAICAIDNFLSSLYAFCGLSPTAPERSDTTISLLDYIEELELPVSKWFEGWVDCMFARTISGWARNRGSNEPLTLDLYIDGRKVASTVANEYRPDLQAGGIGTGRYAFAFRVDSNTASDCRHVRVVVSGTGVVIRHTQNARESFASGAFARSAS